MKKAILVNQKDNSLSNIDNKPLKQVKKLSKSSVTGKELTFSEVALNSLKTPLESKEVNTYMEPYFNEDLEVGKITDFDEYLEPAPDAIDKQYDRKMWMIEGYKIWANSYRHALELLPLIQSF